MNSAIRFLAAALIIAPLLAADPPDFRLWKAEELAKRDAALSKKVGPDHSAQGNARGLRRSSLPVSLQERRRISRAARQYRRCRVRAERRGDSATGWHDDRQEGHRRCWRIRRIEARGWRAPCARRGRCDSHSCEGSPRVSGAERQTHYLCAGEVPGGCTKVRKGKRKKEKGKRKKVIMQSRRDFLIGAASLATMMACRTSRSRAAQEKSGAAWDSGEVAHLLPTVNHQRFLIKASFKSPHQGGARTSRRQPESRRDARPTRTDCSGCSMQTGSTRPPLRSCRSSTRRGRALCDPWPLATFPSPPIRPKSLQTADLFLRRRTRHPARPQAYRRQHAPIPDACSSAANARARACRSLRMRSSPTAITSTGTCVPSAPILLGMSPAARAYAGSLRSARARARHAERRVSEESCWTANRGPLRHDDAIDASVLSAGRSRLFRDRRGRRHAGDAAAGSVHAEPRARIAAAVLPGVPARRTSRPGPAVRIRSRSAQRQFPKASARFGMADCSSC